jgi:RNase P/RNase MRP subunit POP5
VNEIMLRAIDILKRSSCHKKFFSSFRAASALELVREGEVKNAIRTVVDPASGRNLISTASLQVSDYSKLCFLYIMILASTG